MRVEHTLQPSQISLGSLRRSLGGSDRRLGSANVGLRWAGHDCDCIRDGEHITIFSAITVVREFTADPTREYQPGDKTTRTYRNREPKPAP